MKSWIEGLGSIGFVVLLMTSMLVVSIPSVTSSPDKSVKLLIDSNWGYPAGGFMGYNIVSQYGDVLTSFSREGENGGTLYCKIYVTNTGTEPDSYSLTITENVSPKWGATFVNTGENTENLLNMAAGENRKVEISIPIPNNAAIGAEDNIKVKAQGTGVSSENYVIARVSRKLYPANEDTFTRSSSGPNTPQDSFKPESMYVGTYTPTNDVENGYLKFDLRGIAPGTKITSARLMIFCYSGYPYGGTQGLFYLNWVENDDWVEDNLTHNNNPGYDNLVDSKFIEGIIRDTAENWLDWDITDILNWERENGNNILSLCLRIDDPTRNASISLRTKQYHIPERHPYIDLVGKSMRVSIDPSTRKAFAGGTFYYTVTVQNLNVAGVDNYTLTVSDNAGWNPKLQDNRLVNVGKGESRTTKMWVTVPGGTAVGENLDKITVDGISDDNVASSSYFCYVTVVDNLLQPADDDTYVAQGYPDNNFGNATAVDLQSFTEDYKNERIFIKYNLAGLPPENNVTSAKLYYWCWNAYADDLDAEVWTVDNDNWTETTLTWNNQPAYGNVLDMKTLTSWPTTVENTWISWDVTPYVAGQRLTDNIASFCMKAEVENTSGRYWLDARETPFKWENLRPYLEITLGPDQPKVDVSISPVHRIDNANAEVTYTVKVMNTGNVTDSYTLSKTDDEGWTITLDDTSFTNVKPGDSRTTTLRVTLPGTEGAEDSIKVTATGSASDSENCTASVRRVGGWEVAGYAPRIDNYGVAVTGVGSGSYIYAANSNTLGTRVNLMRYNTSTGEWDYRATPPIATPFKNGTVLAWDGSDYIYALCGGSYDDVAENSSARHYFYRYKISTNTWENLENTGGPNLGWENNLGAQGAGDAMVVAGSYVYAIVGQNEIDSTFWRYNIATNTWAQLTAPWASTDDGCSLVWTGGAYLYALRGEWQETTPDKSFSRYHIGTNTWISRADIPEPGGVGDGASLLWIEGDNIYATGGSQAYEPAETEGLDDNFYVYSISGNSWTQLEDLPAGIGSQNGPRLGAGSDIYAWRGCEEDSVLWVYSFPIPTILWEGTATISMENLYTVNVDKDLWLYTGSKLVVKFYTYGGAYKNENVIETFTPDWHVAENELAYHPDGIAVEKAKLVLTDGAGAEIDNITPTFTVNRNVLAGRLVEIYLEWPFASPDRKNDLFKEISDIYLQWPFAPVA